MLFTPENAAKVMAGRKTMTRRIAKPGEYQYDGEFAEVLYRDRAKWTPGHTYAIQSGRGKNGIGRVKLLNIRLEPLQDISDDDICAELGIMRHWPADAPFPEPYPRQLRVAFANLWDSINPKGKRWTDNPDVWVLTFEVVR